MENRNEVSLDVKKAMDLLSRIEGHELIGSWFTHYAKATTDVQRINLLIVMPPGLMAWLGVTIDMGDALSALMIKASMKEVS